MHTIGSRLKVWRESLSLKQADAASSLGLSPSTYQNYERDVRAPNTEGWNAFAMNGINTNWLLTGKGPMLLTDITPTTVSATLDPERLRFTLQAVEEGLAETGRAMAPDRKAELVIAIYDLCEESSISKEKVLKLVKFAGLPISV
jgi:DNA-binding XRE family transcriptional regulator